MHHSAVAPQSRHRPDCGDAGVLAHLASAYNAETPLWRKDDVAGATRYRRKRPAHVLRQALSASRAELHPPERGETTTTSGWGRGSTDLAGALQRGSDPWPDGIANPRPRPLASPSSLLPVQSSVAAPSAWPRRLRPRPMRNGIRWQVASPAATGPLIPATATRAACSSPPAPGPAMAAANSPRLPIWPPASNRSRSPRRCWPLRARVRGRCVVAGCPARRRAR